MNNRHSDYFALIPINGDIAIQRRNVIDPIIKNKIISYDLTVKYLKTKKKKILTYNSLGERDRMLKQMISQKTITPIIE